VSTQRLDNAKTSLDQIRKSLAGSDLTDTALQGLRTELDPLSQSVQAVIADLSPRLTDMKTRLDQLGPKPSDNAPPENPSISAERDNQQKLYDATDAELKQARLLAVEIQQTATIIVDRRRVLFTHALFARSQSLLSPSLWGDVISEVPRDAGSIADVGRAWLSGAVTQLAGWSAAAFALALAVLVVLYAVVARVARRVLAREMPAGAPSRLRKAIAALWRAAVTVVVPVAATLALVALMRAFRLIDTSFDSLVQSIVEAVARVALALGIARGLFAPHEPNWRLLDIGDRAAKSVVRFSVVVAIIVSINKVFNALNDLVAASLPASVALSGLCALLVALVIAATLRSLVDIDDGDGESDEVSVDPQWHFPLRLFTWAVIAAIVAAVFVGYVAFAGFLVDQIVWVAFVGSVLYLLILLANDGLTAALEPHASVGRAIMTSIGLRRDALGQTAVLLSGATSVALFVAAAFLVLAPWGVESTDLFGSLHAAYFGFAVDGITISPAGVVSALLLFAVVLLVTRAVQRWLELTFLPKTQLDSGLRNSIKTSIGYVGFIAAVALALARLGLTFSQLAIVAGALSVGIGFGLQSIVNNFVSGLILLWERAIRVGDWVVVGDEQGYVKRINVRSTEIETFDRATMIVPNSNLISGVVKNWVSGDRVGRIRIPVPVNLVADPEQVREVLIACAKAHDHVLKIPSPQAIFAGIDAAGLKFELLCYVGDVETSMRVKSDLHFEIFKRFKDAGIGIAPPGAPPPVVNINGVGRADDPPPQESQPTEAPRRLGTK
jgi:small-conductance mechanosensitive channel